MRFAGSTMEQAIEAESDIFGRDQFAAGLLNLFESSDDPLVVALDEKWGTGKTVFARRLEKQATNKGFTVVYFDSFKRDYDPDVFIALSAELLAKLPENKEKSSLRTNAKIVGKTIGKLALKAAVRFGTAGALKAADFGEANEESAAEIADLAEAELDALIDKRLEGAKVADETFTKFRNSLCELATSTDPDKPKKAKPLIFIVDELDRCKPDYSLAVLETIKHFFLVPNIYFLLVCDLNQMVSAVTNRYGIDGHGYAYLEKFIDVRVSFPKIKEDRLEAAISHFFDFNKNIPDDLMDGNTWIDLQKFVTRNVIMKNYSIRQVEKIITQFSIVMHFLRKEMARIDPAIILLCDMKISYPIMFQKARLGKLIFDEIDSTYDLGVGYSNNFRNMIQALFGRTFEDKKRFDFEKIFFTYNFDTTEEIREYLINDVIERIEF